MTFQDNIPSFVELIQVIHLSSPLNASRANLSSRPIRKKLAAFRCNDPRLVARVTERLPHPLNHLIASSNTEFRKDLNKNTLESCLELFWKMFWLHHTNLQRLFCTNNNTIMLFILVNRIRHRRPWIIKRLCNSSMFSEYVMNFVTDNNF